jgi:hypothetical protein
MPFYYVNDSRAFDACPPGTYTQAGNTLVGCLLCPSDCTSCSANGAPCLTCAANYYLSMGLCFACPGTSKNPVGNSNSQCIDLGINCLTYISNGACQTCSANAYLSDRDCINCTNNQVNPLNNSAIICVSCNSTCLTCSSENISSCLSCPANTYLFNQVCTACRENTTNF